MANWPSIQRRCADTTARNYYATAIQKDNSEVHEQAGTAKNTNPDQATTHCHGLICYKSGRHKRQLRRWNGGGNTDFHNRSGVPVRDPQFTSELSHALAHSPKTYADTAGLKLQSLLGHALAIVFDRQQKPALFLSKGHTSFLRARMAQHIG